MKDEKIYWLLINEGFSSWFKDMWSRLRGRKEKTLSRYMKPIVESILPLSGYKEIRSTLLRSRRRMRKFIEKIEVRNNPNDVLIVGSKSFGVKEVNDLFHRRKINIGKIAWIAVDGHAPWVFGKSYNEKRPFIIPAWMMGKDRTVKKEYSLTCVVQRDKYPRGAEIVGAKGIRVIIIVGTDHSKIVEDSTTLMAVKKVSMWAKVGI